MKATGPVRRRVAARRVRGDTVNVAARICDRAAPSSVVIAASAWPMIRGQYRGRSLGSVELKGKGPLELVECLPLDR